MLNITLLTTIGVIIPGIGILIGALALFSLAGRVEYLFLREGLIELPSFFIPPTFAIVFLVILVEGTISSNSVQMEERQWSLGQTFALLVAAIPVLDLVSTIRKTYHIPLVPRTIANLPFWRKLSRSQEAVHSSDAAINANVKAISTLGLSPPSDLGTLQQYTIRCQRVFSESNRPSAVEQSHFVDAVWRCQTIHDLMDLLDTIEHAPSAKVASTSSQAP